MQKHQDYIYLESNYYDKPKEQFSFLKNLIIENLAMRPEHKISKTKNLAMQTSNKTLQNADDTSYIAPPPIDILDVGCARGEFLYFLKNNLGFIQNLGAGANLATNLEQNLKANLKSNLKINLYGLDYSPELINSAKSFSGLEGVNFIVGSAEDFSLEQKFDYIVMTGVLGYFDDISKVLKNLSLHLKPQGRIFILGGFNNYDVDVIIRYRNNAYFSTFESGWNFHSIHTIKKLLQEFNLKLQENKPFILSFKDSPKADPCRSWHIDTESGLKYTNGLGLLFELSALVIAHKD